MTKTEAFKTSDFVAGWGTETWLQYVDGFELRHFCAFELLDDPKGYDCIADYTDKVAAAAASNGFGAIIDGIHYRASPDWGDLIGYSRDALRDVNRRGIELYREIAGRYETDETPMLVGAAIGPRGDAYETGHKMDMAEAEDYHAQQIDMLKDAGADLVTAATFSSPTEAAGLVRAAAAAGVPVAVSFIAKGGKLSGGETLSEAIGMVDDATDGAALHFTINCTHPTEFEAGLSDGAWTRRLGGFLPNAVAMELLSLCRLGHLEDGDPVELGGQMADLARRFPHARIWGGCCGTDARHIAEIARQVGAVRKETMNA